MSVDLSTKYLGLTLKNPLVVAACPITEDLEMLRRLEEAGAAAAVFPSLFQEQIEHEEMELSAAREYGTDSFAEALTYFPEQSDFRAGPNSYLENLEAAKKNLSIPIIGSLNGTSEGGWIRYAKMMEDAGVDALELNVYFIAANIDMTGQEVESRYVELVQAVKESVSIPLAVKVGPYFSSTGDMAKKLVAAGADGLVLFNRFLQPDIDFEEMQASPKLELSTQFEMLLPLRWIAILHGRVQASLALTSGLHTAEDMIKSLMAGADVGMVASTVYRNGFGQIGKILSGLGQWVEEKEYESVRQMIGSMSQQNSPDPAAFERGNYMKALTSYSGEPV
jgi:dihydroorotate dehydrogenase (fumarate)